MKMRLAEAPPRKAGDHFYAGQFRGKPGYRLPQHCPLCGGHDHVGRTTCTPAPFIPRPTQQPERASLPAKQATSN